MIKTLRHDVSGTAFLTNYSRSQLVHLSKDIYAHLWVTPEARSLWDELSEKVYPNDAINLALRNRFFLDHIENFVKGNRNARVVSIAAGFDNYPFLVETDCNFIEIDLPNIISYKETKIRQWMQEKSLPQRNIEFIATDLTDKKERLIMKDKLKKTIQQKPSLVFMEGLTYYLKRNVLSHLFDVLREVQGRGSLAAFDYWRPDALESPVMQRLKNFLNQKFGRSGEDWNLFDETFIKQIQGYAAIEHTDIAALEKRYADTRVLQSHDSKIPGNFAVLQRVTEREVPV